jgi:hypothetical protein
MRQGAPFRVLIGTQEASKLGAVPFGQQHDSVLWYWTGIKRMFSSEFLRQMAAGDD